MKAKEAFSAFILTAVAVALTLTTIVLAPLPLMLLRRNGGRLALLFCALLGGVFLFLLVTPKAALVYGAAALVAFVYGECENQGLGYTTTVLTTMLVLTGFSFISLGLAMKYAAFEPVRYFQIQVDELLQQIALPSGVKMDKDALIYQVPSAFLIASIFSIWMNSVLVTRLEKALGWRAASQKTVIMGPTLRKWKLPDSFVWVALVSTVGTFFDVKPSWVHWVAANAFNLVVMLYFFQGLAVIVDFFTVKKVAPIWRTISYFFIFSQLFLMVSFLGFVDLWLGFRGRMKPDKSALA